jgi:hypothetical protein
MEVNQTIVKHEPEGWDSHTVNVKGLVTVRQGDTIIFEQKPNHFVREGLISLARVFSMAYSGIGVYGYLYFPGGYWTVGIGTGNAAIVASLTALTTQISNSPASKSVTGIFISSDYLTRSVRFLALWAPGVLNALLGENSISEIGLYLNNMKGSSSPYILGSQSTGIQAYNLVCAISSAGANSVPDFTAFVPDINKPVEVEWKIQVGFT